MEAENVFGSVQIPNNATRIVTMVDNYRYAEPQGRWCSPYLPNPIGFSNLLDWINGIERFYNEHRFTQANTQLRSFLHNKQPIAELPKKEVQMYKSEEDLLQNSKGEKATFIVQVLFRQNSTWQGTVKWIETGKTEKFRSMLELIRMIDGAVNASQISYESEGKDDILPI